MNHADHVHLLRGGVPQPGGVWADVGSGSGAFTLALAELVGPEACIHSVDKNQKALREQERRMRAHFPSIRVEYHHADYTRPLDLPPLDGMVMANALHFQRRKDPALQLLKSYLKPGGRFILIEYDTDRGNTWVPYPLSYATWAALAARSGFVETERLATRPSSFLGRFYAALSLRPDRPHKPM